MRGMRSAANAAFLLLLCTAACNGNSGPASDGGNNGDGGNESDAGDGGNPHDGGNDAGGADGGGNDGGDPFDGGSTVADAGADGGLAFADSAPPMGSISFVANYDSVQLLLPDVAGAVEYRAFAVPAGTQAVLGGDGRERINGTTVFCAGIEQHNAPAAAKKVLKRLEVTDLHGPTVIVVEALDRACPFPGILGKTHDTIQIGDPTEIDAPALHAFSIYSEADIRSTYGSLILNGQGSGPTVGSPAPADDPKVLARSQIVVTPLGNATRPAMTFFDDFSNPSDQPVLTNVVVDDKGRSQSAKLFRNSKWNWFTYAADHVQLFIDRGQLVTAVADLDQGVFASILGFPRHAPAKLSDTSYLHITYEVESNVTSRRYWWILVCGAGTAGQTFDANNLITGHIVPTSAFFEPDGLNPSVEGWNCFHLFPRDGWSATLPPDNTNPETDIRVMVNKPVASATNRSNVINLTPDQFHNASIGPPSWYRQINAAGQPVAPMLDDKQHLSPRTHFDVYLRRDRAIFYVDGEQRLCNDFSTHPLTMAEGAVAFNQVLYHSAAERIEFSVDYWDKRGQRYYLNNAPFLDQRFWDNVGFDELQPAPGSFDASKCFAYAP